MNGRFVLVTGSGTGIGKACALYLAKMGFSVIAGVRRDALLAAVLKRFLPETWFEEVLLMALNIR
jgi:NAD(P)-dependent dehydrogenase (short-subunit alcohol dehydrogenase family)